MKDKVVVYTSESGFTKKYAGWIAEALDCCAMDIKEWRKHQPSEFDVVIYGGGVYASSIKGLKKLKEQMKMYPNVRLLVFTTGATPAAAKDLTQKVLDDNFTKEERQKIPAFYFQAGLDYGKMSMGSKLLMKMFSSMMAKKADKNEEEKKMAEMMSQSYDICDKESIKELVECARGEKKSGD